MGEHGDMRINYKKYLKIDAETMLRNISSKTEALMIGMIWRWR